MEGLQKSERIFGVKFNMKALKEMKGCNEQDGGDGSWEMKGFRINGVFMEGSKVFVNGMVVGKSRVLHVRILRI